MTENQDVLFSIAQISVAFAGFLGIITAVDRGDGSDWNQGNLSRLRSMIFSSLSAIVASLLHFAFLLNSDNINWVWCVGLLGVYLFIQTCIAFIRLVTEPILKSNSTN